MFLCILKARQPCIHVTRMLAIKRRQVETLLQSDSVAVPQA